MSKSKRTMKEIQEVLLGQQEHIDNIAETLDTYVPRIELLAKTVLAITTKLNIKCLDPACNCGKDVKEEPPSKSYEEAVKVLESALVYERKQKEEFHRAAVKFEADAKNLVERNNNQAATIDRLKLRIDELTDELAELKIKTQSRAARGSEIQTKRTRTKEPNVLTPR